MREQDFKALVDYRLEEAREALGDAELLLGAGRYRAAANRLYYAAFYAAAAAPRILKALGSDRLL